MLKLKDPDVFGDTHVVTQLLRTIMAILRVGDLQLMDIAVAPSSPSARA